VFSSRLICRDQRLDALQTAVSDLREECRVFSKTFDGLTDWLDLAEK
jgi:hypothetical protein